MNFNSYNVFNRTEFEAAGLVSRTVTVNLENVGVKDILITKGNELGITFEDTFLIVNFEDQNPYYRNGYAVLEDENHDIWLGIEIVE